MESSSQNVKNIGVIIMAAGAGERFGGKKMLVLLPNSKTLIRHIVDIVLDTQLSPVIVILGRDADLILKEIEDLPLTILQNEQWQKGISTSLQIGVRALPEECDACLIVLGDQPFISVELIDKLVQYYEMTKPQILFPVVNDRQTNPVILDRSTFFSIMQLRGDTGARKLFHMFNVQRLEWLDEKLQLDIDTEDDLKIVQLLMASNNTGSI